MYESQALGAGKQQECSVSVRRTESTGSVSCYSVVTPVGTQLRTLILVTKRMDFYPVLRQYQYDIPPLRLQFVVQQSQIVCFITTNTQEYKSLLICNFILTHWARERDLEEGNILPLITLVHSY